MCVKAGMGLRGDDGQGGGLGDLRCEVGSLCESARVPSHGNKCRPWVVDAV